MVVAHAGGELAVTGLTPEMAAERPGLYLVPQPDTLREARERHLDFQERQLDKAYAEIAAGVPEEKRSMPPQQLRLHEWQASVGAILLAHDLRNLSQLGVVNPALLNRLQDQLQSSSVIAETA